MGSSATRILLTGACVSVFLEVAIAGMLRVDSMGSALENASLEGLNGKGLDAPSYARIPRQDSGYVGCETK